MSKGDHHPTEKLARADIIGGGWPEVVAAARATGVPWAEQAVRLGILAVAELAVQAMRGAIDREEITTLGQCEDALARITIPGQDPRSR